MDGYTTKIYQPDKFDTMNDNSSHIKNIIS